MYKSTFLNTQKQWGQAMTPLSKDTAEETKLSQTSYLDLIGFGVSSSPSSMLGTRKLRQKVIVRQWQSLYSLLCLGGLCHSQSLLALTPAWEKGAEAPLSFQGSGGW